MISVFNWMTLLIKKMLFWKNMSKESLYLNYKKHFIAQMFRFQLLRLYPIARKTTVTALQAPLSLGYIHEKYYKVITVSVLVCRKYSASNVLFTVLSFCVILRLLQTS